MTSNIARGILLIIFLLCSLAADAQNRKSDLIHQLISDMYGKKYFNGAIVVGRDDVLYQVGVGKADYANNFSFDALKPSDGGSLAKTFTAASILLLEIQGKLKLHDPVQKYLSGYPYLNTTIWNLITHSTGGLPDYDYYFNNFPDTDIITNNSILFFINKSKPTLHYLPGTNFYYDNAGFDLAALVVEKVTGLTYENFVKQHFFGPLKMDSAFVRPAGLNQFKGHRTIGYRWDRDSLLLNDIADREGFHGGGNIWISAQDLYQWGKSFYHDPGLGKELIRKVTSSVRINQKPSAVTLGAWYRGKSKHAFYYWGNVAGYYSWLYFDTSKKYTIAFVTNTTTPQWVRPFLTSALVDIMEGKKVTNFRPPEADYIDTNNLSRIAGTYYLKTAGRVRISVTGNIPKLHLSNGMDYRMFLVDTKTFYVPGLDPWISFSSSTKNKFQKLIWRATTLHEDGIRVKDH